LLKLGAALAFIFDFNVLFSLFYFFGLSILNRNSDHFFYLAHGLFIWFL